LREAEEEGGRREEGRVRRELEKENRGRRKRAHPSVHQRFPPSDEDGVLLEVG